MSENLLSAAVVIGTLKVKTIWFGCQKYIDLLQLHKGNWPRPLAAMFFNVSNLF